MSFNMRSVFGRFVLCGVFCCLLASLVKAQNTFNLGPGQSITSSTFPNGDIPDGSIVNVNGGTIGFGVDLSNGTLNVNSGNVAVGAVGIAQGFTNFNNTVNLNGGNIGGFFQLGGPTQLNISSGTIESFGLFDTTTEVNITGGTVTRFPDLFEGTLNISGGDVFSLRAFGGTTNIFGSDFALDGVPIEGLVPGEVFEVTQRQVQLTATLTDGSFFETDLNTNFGGFFSANPDGAEIDAIINLNFVLPGDFDGDADVDGADFLLLQQGLGNDDFNANDLANLQEQFGVSFNGTSLVNAATALPEPTSLGLLAGASVCGLRRKR